MDPGTRLSDAPAEPTRTAPQIVVYRHMDPPQRMWRRIDGLSRYAATARVAKYRLFVWCDVRICPDQQLIVITRDDDTTFGILHSRFHEVWSLRLGTSLEDRPRYTPNSTFETFPFPPGLTPDIPAAGYADDPRSMAVALEARRLVGGSTRPSGSSGWTSRSTAIRSGRSPATRTQRRRSGSAR